jgi:hypothetical protein
MSMMLNFNHFDWCLPIMDISSIYFYEVSVKHLIYNYLSAILSLIFQLKSLRVKIQNFSNRNCFYISNLINKQAANKKGELSLSFFI